MKVNEKQYIKMASTLIIITLLIGSIALIFSKHTVYKAFTTVCKTSAMLIIGTDYKTVEAPTDNEYYSSLHSLRCTDVHDFEDLIIQAT